MGLALIVEKGVVVGGIVEFEEDFGVGFGVKDGVGDVEEGVFELGDEGEVFVVVVDGGEEGLGEGEG